MEAGEEMAVVAPMAIIVAADEAPTVIMVVRGEDIDIMVEAPGQGQGIMAGSGLAREGAPGGPVGGVLRSIPTTLLHR